MRSSNAGVRLRRAVPPALAAALVAVGCAPPEDDAPPEDTPIPEQLFACEIGGLSEDGSFVSLSVDDSKELVLGFQGFLFIELEVLADSGAPTIADALMSITVQDMPSFGLSQPSVAFSATSGGVVSDEILVFFNDADVGSLTGRTAEIVIKLEHEAQVCTTSGTVTLVDEDPCIMTNDEPICPEDTSETE